MAKKNGSPAYLEALKQLTHIINTEYPDGGKLPGALEMCKRLNVCMVTYIKILKILCRESILSASKGRGGTHVRPRNERRRKIGLVIRAAEDSPFLGEFSYVCKAFQVLNEEGFVLHLIQAAKTEQVYDKAIFHGVCGLLWFSPPDLKTAAEIEKIQKETDIPVMAMTISNRTVRNAFDESRLNCVIQDYKQEYKHTAEFLLSHGHKNIIRVDNYDPVYSERFIQTAKEAGLENVHYLTADRLKKALLSKIRETGVTAILSEGGYAVYRTIFDLIETLPRSSRPEILLRNAGNMPPDMKARHPNITMLGRLLTDDNALVETGTKMLLNHIRKGTPLQFTAKDVFSVQSIL